MSMIAGLIEEHLGASEYRVRLSYDTALTSAVIADVNANIEQATQKKNAELEFIDDTAEEISDLLEALRELQQNIKLEQDKPSQPAEGYDFKDLSEVARLTNLINNTQTKLSLKYKLAATLSSLISAENNKPRLEDDNPECLIDFYCAARLDHYSKSQEEALSDAEDIGRDLPGLQNDLQAEQRKPLHPDDAPPGYYQDADQLKEWLADEAEGKGMVDDFKAEIAQSVFYLNMINAELLELRSKLRFVKKYQGGDKAITAFSNEYDESLKGVVAVAVIAGASNTAVIVKGGKVNGRMVTPINIGREHCFSNIALMPGWLKWCQQFGVGIITNSNFPIAANLVPLTHKLNIAGSILPFGHANIEMQTIYAYEVQDQALIEYDADGVMSYRGWYKNPRSRVLYCGLFSQSILSYVDYSTGDGTANYATISVSDQNGLVYVEDNGVLQDGIGSMPLQSMGTDRIGINKVNSLTFDFNTLTIQVDYTQADEETAQATYPIPENWIKPKFSDGYWSSNRSFKLWRYCSVYPNRWDYLADSQSLITNLTGSEIKNSIYEIGGFYFIEVKIFTDYVAVLANGAEEDDGSASQPVYYYVILDKDLNFVDYTWDNENFNVPERLTVQVCH